MYKLLKEKYKTTTLIAAFLLMIFNINAQVASDTSKSISPILVTNHTEHNRPVILVKWLTDNLLYPLGVNIYRQEIGDITWLKLNQKPLIKGMYQPTDAEYKADSTLKPYIEITKKLKPSDLKEMTKVMVLVKCVQSEGFARYLGIQFTDTSISKNMAYRYKVTSITSKGEESIGHSAFIKSEPFVTDVPPSGIEIKALDKSVTVKWKPEDLRFHGVNIYRCTNRDTTMNKINKIPLMVSKLEKPKGKSEYPDIFFTDYNLQNGIKYSYRLTGIDFFGRETRLSEKISVMPGDHTPPNPPSYIRSKIDKYSVRISWRNLQPSPDQEGINIYRSYKYDNQYVKINTQLLAITDTVYVDMDLKSGFYYYTVASVDSAGNDGLSNKVLAEVHDITPPATPQNIKALADTGRIILTWDPNTEPDLMGYQIFRTVDNDLEEFYVLMNSDAIKTNTFIDTLPRNARNHFLYKVTAIDSSFNRSAYPPPVRAQMPDVTPPVKPVIIGVSPNNEYMVVEWIPNKELDLAGYELYRSKGADGVKTKVNTGLLAPSVTRFTDRTIASDTLYYYTIFAIDSAGNRSVPSAAFMGMHPSIGSKENDSEIIKFSIKQPLFSKSLKLQWTAKTSSSFIGYAVYKRITPDAEPQKLFNLTTNKSYIDTDKKARTAQYQLRLYHKSGNVVKSEWISKQ